MSPSATVADLLDRLTRSEKLRLVRGGVDPDGRATGYVPPIPRVGIPASSMTDGPTGVRAGRSTAYPASMALAAAWDPELAERFGAALATEARTKGFDAVLGPGVNLLRDPRCGRSFEYLGEDPLLTSSVGAAVVRGIESRDALAVAKHFVANHQERDRLTVSAEVGERALRELYFPGFEAAVRAGAGGVMTAYNRVGGVYASEHRRLLTAVLREEWGFEGVTVSDWGAVHDGAEAAIAGLDLEMPGVSARDLLTDDRGRPVGPRRFARRWPIWLPSDREDLLRAVFAPAADEPDAWELLRPTPFARDLPEALDRGALSPARLDEMVERLLGRYERLGVVGARDRVAVESDPGGWRRLAREVAVRGTVLLKNAAGTLPLDADPGTVALLGADADEAKASGGGSAAVTPRRRVSPLSGLRRRVGAGSEVVFERGVPRVGRLPLPEVPLLPRLRERDPRFEDAVDAAAGADVAVVVAGDAATEGADRPDLSLPGAQDRLIRAVADTGTPTVVVLTTSGPVEMPWLDAVDAVVEVWYPGQEAGDALARVLFGDDDPGGRLPVTFGAAAGDYPAKTRAQYPGVRGRAGYREARYDEGIFVGYRGFDAGGTAPLFPFGHGLSYANFAYRDLVVDGEVPEVRSAGESPTPLDSVATAEATVENVGDRAGREVVQAYVEPEGSVGADGSKSTSEPFPRPPRELAGFTSVELAPGESRTVSVPLADRAFAVYDERASGWVVDRDAFTVAVGRSSRDLRPSARLGE
ncbi:glycoside hydrolase family 3 C-terminal domain-containing protein [Halobium salinum]|uniref:Glycoside hydrolase family 3 C-terminal domain-containing protein n=1 Tax=Halobium salinum TaxID=1364940 RepID=A0ABD5PAG7_9EURY|nr:glycoside hydrolase family 3 C-terminal domain-containing protein [Halobium salinum]